MTAAFARAGMCLMGSERTNTRTVKSAAQHASLFTAQLLTRLVLLLIGPLARHQVLPLLCLLCI